MSASNDDWLRKILAESQSCKKPVKATTKLTSLPNYERNATTLNALSSVRTLNEQANLHAEAQIELYTSLAAEYQAQSEALKRILMNVGIDGNALPEELKMLVMKLISYQQTNNQQDRYDEMELMKQPRTLNQTAAIQLLQNVKCLAQSIDETSTLSNQDMLKKKKEAEFLSKKGVEYTSSIRHLEKRLASVNFNSTLSHSVLLQRAKDLDGLQAKLKELRSKLSAYGDITPDITLARIQVQKAKEDLAELENEISAKLGTLHL